MGPAPAPRRLAGAEGRPDLASGEEKTIPKLPQGYGFKVGGDETWGINYMIHALTAAGDRRVQITWEIDWVPETSPARTGSIKVKAKRKRSGG